MKSKKNQLGDPLTQQLQQIELQIFCQFLKICQQEHLRYYLLGGTLLGAVRHQGFIPWDDDIDVGMPRKDYEIFLQKAPALLPKPYFLQTHQTDPGYILNFAKIRNSATTFIETSMSNRHINHGVYIDVFPLDFYPASKLQQLLCDIRLKALHFRMRQEFIIPKEYKASAPKRALQWLLMKASKIVYPSVKETISKREQTMTAYTDTAFMANFCGAWGKKEIVPSGWYGEGKTVLFEGMPVVIPLHYDKWLTRVYGNYMQLPPPSQQKSHHYTKKIDVHTSFTCYTPGI